ncbi:hypothetical protein WICPIJ_000524 [Wickerhamomyces pijperi]|uniref:Uncharacterized protein n=1 Tax=Wickerhamomyces pijperi TaxID=599730 RepID=A0A9P8TRN1_WICPI|nr:hypothetical protein WICPIJ_000524 [Wickerhamomyces pijperi]
MGSTSGTTSGTTKATSSATSGTTKTTSGTTKATSSATSGTTKATSSTTSTTSSTTEATSSTTSSFALLLLGWWRTSNLWLCLNTFRWLNSEENFVQWTQDFVNLTDLSLVFQVDWGIEVWDLGIYGTTEDVTFDGV